MTDVLLVNSPVRKTRSDWHAGLSLPLGIAYIGAVLMKHGYSASAIDFNVSGLNADRLRTAVESEDPAVLGISTHTETYMSGLEIARIAKETKPSLLVVMGGPHATVMHEDVAAEAYVDFVIRGEGEYGMLELTRLLVDGTGSLEGIQGLVHKRDGRVMVNDERPFIEDPDELPFPARGMLPVDLYAYGGNVLASRGGCPFSCAFCAVNNIWKGRRRFRSPGNVTDEISQVLRMYGLREINFADDTFTLDRRRTLALCEALKAIPVPYPWSWTCGTRVDLVDEELLGVMREAGCSAIQLGVETGSQDLMDAMGKRITLEQVRTAVALAKGAGLGVLCSFMFPQPDDTEETIREQIRFMKELNLMGAKLSMACTTPYPGTYYYDHASDLGINILADNWDDFDAKHLVIETRHLSQERLQGLLREIVEQVGLSAG